MIQMNLIPYREEVLKVKTRRRIATAIALVLLFAASVGMFHVYVTMTVSAMEKEVKASQAELERLRAITGDIEKYRRDKTLVETKLRIIEELEKNRDEAYRLLTELSVAVPEGQVWFAHVSKQGSMLRLEGTARNNGAVALLMERMEASPVFASVELAFSRRITYASMDLKSFKIYANLQ